MVFVGRGSFLLLAADSLNSVTYFFVFPETVVFFSFILMLMGFQTLDQLCILE